MAGKFRLLWVPSHERKFRVGDVASEEELSKAGYSTKDMVERGEAEVVSSPADKDHAGSKKGGKSK